MALPFIAATCSLTTAMNSGNKTTYKPYKVHKRLNIPKLSRIVKPKKIFELFKRVFRALFLPSSPLPMLPLKEEGYDPFMACMVKVDCTKTGWHRDVARLVANCKQDTRFRMDPDGNVVVSGIGDPEKMLRKLGRTRRAKLVQFQYGSCSRNLYLPPEPKPKTDVQLQPSQFYGYNPHACHPRPHMGYGNPYYHQLPAQQGYEYGHPSYLQPHYSGYAYDPRQLPLPSNY